MTSYVCLSPAPLPYILLIRPNTQAYPVTEQTLSHFAAFLSQQQLKHRTIKSFLSGIRFAQIQLRLGDPFKDKSMSLLEYVMAGIKRKQAKVGTPPKLKLPITPDILQRLMSVWLCSSVNPDHIMLWAAACTGFFGFLRAGEFTIPTAQEYNPDMHLGLQGLAVENPSDPTLFCIRIKHGKTDPFRQGADILYLGATHVSICPVQTFVDFIAVRTPEPGSALCIPVRHTIDKN